jgi:hypothetical protein
MNGTIVSYLSHCLHHVKCLWRWTNSPSDDRKLRPQSRKSVFIIQASLRRSKMWLIQQTGGCFKYVEKIMIIVWITSSASFRFPHIYRSFKAHFAKFHDSSKSFIYSGSIFYRVSLNLFFHQKRRLSFGMFMTGRLIFISLLIIGFS